MNRRDFIRNSLIGVVAGAGAAHAVARPKADPEPLVVPNTKPQTLQQLVTEEYGLSVPAGGSGGGSGGSGGCGGGNAGGGGFGTTLPIDPHGGVSLLRHQFENATAEFERNHPPLSFKPFV